VKQTLKRWRQTCRCAPIIRYFAGCIRAQEGLIGEIDKNTVAYHFHEPLERLGAFQISLPG